MAVATVWFEDGEGRRWPIAATCSLGRSPTNDVVIDDGKVSRRHALVHKQDDAEFWIIDLGSGNGTYLNGRRLTQPTRLADGDRLQLGDHALSFRHIAGRPLEAGKSRLSAQTIISIKDAACWLLVADIKGSSGLAARLSSTDMAILVGRWMGSCKEIVDAHGGAINKFLGDGFFAYWLAEATDRAQIVKVIRALQLLQADATGPRFRVVVHQGRAAVGGGGSLGEDSLTGADVTLVFRMEKIASELGCELMASEAARTHLQGPLQFRELGSHAVAGLAGPPRQFYSVA